VCESFFYFGRAWRRQGKGRLFDATLKKEDIKKLRKKSYLNFLLFMCIRFAFRAFGVCIQKEKEKTPLLIDLIFHNRKCV